MLTNDLAKAAEAIDSQNGAFKKVMNDIQKSIGDSQKTMDTLNNAETQAQLSMARNVLNSRAMKGRPQDSKVFGRGSRGNMMPRGLPEKTSASGEDPSLEAGLAKMKLQPKDREQLIQGAKAPTPESYQPFVRDYYNRLTETKGK
jgi:hypothetical protein